MQSKLCLVLALVVLFGALAVGNPFLSHGSAVVPDGSAEPFSEGGSGIALRLAEGAPTAASTETPVGSHSVGSQLVSLHAMTPIPSAPGAVRCPDEHLRDLVVRVLHDHAGMPVWELRDGRFVRANPRHGEGEPLVVLVDAGVLDADKSLEAGK